ncbi:transport and Golgi organization protein 6 homolog [Homarus americanus]|uniref:transport and Golgi organization protein 6 homolog n=1 Tax=Homarus americanus TaxID=6706 RepID=UPI001C45B4CF|nr:transport and Golgi organization protein 6 homolog [Homarus americanus]XP_042213457.1 transport and Golgi organization protein 6 homolog [Homarus americanus]
MSYQDLFQGLNDLSKLGSKGWTSLENVTAVVTTLKRFLCWHLEDKETQGDDVAAVVLADSTGARTRICASLNQLLSCVDTVSRPDVRLECGCLAVAVLQEIYHQLQMASSKSLYSAEQTEEEIGKKKQRENQAPPPSPSLISVQQTKVAEDASRVAMYTTVLGCLDAEASIYVKMTLAKSKFLLGTDLMVVPHNFRHKLLASIMKILLPLIQHESLGIGVRRSLFPEILSATLELCFSPMEVKTFPEDAAFFREQLEVLMNKVDTTLTLQHLLLLQGIVQGGVWLGKVCRSLVVRRFLMKAGGVSAVVVAGLTICDKQDWRRCEAVATLIAQAKFKDMDLFFSTLGPQLSELINKDNLQPEVFRVITLIVAQMVQRSATLTALHVTNTLMQPLKNTTQPDAPSLCANFNLTMCVGRIHKLFVEIPPPSSALTNLLRPVLNPLMMIAALATTRLRTLARQIIIRYLSQLSPEDVVETLLVLSSLTTCVQSPPVNSALRFSVDDDGGVKMDVIVESHKRNVLEEDENLSICLISILEQLKNYRVVLLFYERLALYIDFTSLNEKEIPSTMLITDEEVEANQVEAMRSIVLCCSLLTQLSENDQVTSDLFTDLSAAVPVVHTLIRVGCQKCEDEQLHKIQVSLIMNVIMLVSCYVSDRTLRKKMASEDWNGLKSLLPSLTEIVQNISDETVLLFVEQLKNLVLTHGVVNSQPETVASTKKANKNTSSGSVDVKNHDGVNSTPQYMKGNKQYMKTEEEPDVDTQTDGVVKSGLQAKESKTSASIKMEVDSNNKIEENSNAPVRKAEKKKLTNEKQSSFSYKQAMEDLFSPLLPIRGHALLDLGKLIGKRDEETMTHKEHLLSIFQHNLKEEDSYLYLMAVEGLAVLCDAFPDKVVEILCQEFSVGNRSVEDRTKLAEALTRATRRLGPLLPHYKNHFINAFLTGVRDKEAIVRAASLSGLGDVCKVLRLSLGPIVHEVFGVLYDVVKNEDAVEVRRAAVLVVTLLLQGLGHDAFTVLQEVIRDLYRVLRLIHATDPDDVVRLHAQLAMGEIDTITRQFLLPKLNLTKRIYVTDVPPNSF